MDRLYTAFVSSTYKDLQRQRQLIARNLLEEHCLPLGMEYFPSTGADLWQPILEAISAADFCVFIVAGRYGSIDQTTGVSWTHREFRQAVEIKKPMILLVHRNVEKLPSGDVEHSSEARAGLEELRSEMADIGQRFFEDDSELLTALYASIRALKEQKKILGWIPAPKHEASNELEPRVRYERLEVEMRLAISNSEPGTLDMIYKNRRVVRALAADGIEAITQDFSRESDNLLPFNEKNQPNVSLSSVSRSFSGNLHLEEPRIRIGSTYIQDILFVPPLGQNEVADFTVEAVVPSYKHQYREDLIDATSGTRLGPRDFDFLTRIVGFPTDLLCMRVFLPKTLEARPAGVKAGRAYRIDDSLNAELNASGCYQEWTEVVDDVEGTFMELRVPTPLTGIRYRLAWTLPPRLRHGVRPSL